MFKSVWSRNALAAIAALLVSVPVLTAAIGPATQPAGQAAATLAARVLA